ncbi:MAG TPA: VWA domain-containing protein, partial [Methyloceanibacter sp.]|nr:VWA domain-containing protein [Methyloceanibacter sp.]
MAEPKAPAKTEKSEIAPGGSTRAEIDAFLKDVRALQPSGSGHGRLIFAMDATMSRQPSWDLALELQADMFKAVKAVGGLDVQLVYFRGFNECQASRWVGDPEALARLMRRVSCEGGYTQIRKVLAHAKRENAARKVNAVVYVGDCMEEDVDELGRLAGELGLLGVRAFMFHEGRDPVAERAFRHVAELTRGAYCRFASGSAHE